MCSVIIVIPSPAPHCPIPDWHACCPYRPADRTNVMRTLIRAGHEPRPLHWHNPLDDGYPANDKDL